ncbi:hypothetical protein JW877_06365 [bacterium]|nr:hypothetical protein [bacterium]
MNKDGWGLITVALLLVLGTSISWGQNILARNILEYRGASEGKSSFEDRFDLRASWQGFNAGIRYEVFQPSRGLADTTYEGLTSYYFSFLSEYVDIWVGNYYLTVKNGLILDAYEKRELHLDHDLNGARFALKYQGFELAGFTGRADWDHNALIRGAYGTIPAFIGNLGASYLKYFHPTGDTSEAFSLNGDLRYGILGVWGEYAHKTPLAAGRDGNAIYLGTSIDLWGVIIDLQYKEYDDFLIRSSVVQYNNPPPCILEPYYVLLSKHIYEVQWDDELGFQGEIGYIPFDFLELVTNYAHSRNHESEPLFDESHTEIMLYLDQWDFKVVANYRKEGERRYLTPIIETTYYLDDVNSLNLEFEAQSENEDRIGLLHLFASLQYNHSPDFAIGLEGGRFEGEPENNSFARIYGNYSLSENHKIDVSVGKYPGGFICSGGVCRFEPEFEGLEIKITSMF